jgi:hypothetical protein
VTEVGAGVEYLARVNASGMPAVRHQVALSRPR